jgi:hypothetical protein
MQAMCETRKGVGCKLPAPLHLQSMHASRQQHYAVPGSASMVAICAAPRAACIENKKGQQIVDASRHPRHIPNGTAHAQDMCLFKRTGGATPQSKIENRS